MKDEPKVQQLLARIETGNFVVLDPREDFVAAEIGLSFDGKMIYEHSALVACFQAQNPEWDEEDACDWIAVNVVCAEEVVVA